MQTQITCPTCRATFTTEVFQIVDAQKTPQLKELLLAGALNVADCPQCGAKTNIASPILYHDAEHELLMVHVPMELNLPMHEQERMIGQLAKAVTDSIPPEQFKAYLLQPKTIMTFQTFMEKVLETEGVTPEMIQRQKDQADLLKQLIDAPKLERLSLIQQKTDLIDETFFAILASNLQMLEQNPNPAANTQFLKLTNLQALLFTSTETGKALETQQTVLRGFQQKVKDAGGLTFDLYIDGLLDSYDNEAVQSAIMQMGQQAIRYELFARLSERIEAAPADDAAKLTDIRQKLLEIYESLQASAQEMLEQADSLLDVLIHAQDTSTAVKNNVDKIDENFVGYLSKQIENAQAQGDSGRIEKLQAVYAAIMEMAESQLPPEVRILNALVATNDP
ncbi:MAG: CpXC domain-containing protein, partial [Chloroflexota bacterium]